MANGNERPTHRVDYQVEFDRDEWERFPARVMGHWTSRAIESAPVCFHNPSRNNYIVGTVVEREEYEDFTRRKICIRMMIEGAEVSAIAVDTVGIQLPALACEPERIATGDPEPPTVDEPPTHTAEVRLMMERTEGRWPGGIPEFNTPMEVVGGRGYGFRGVVSEYDRSFENGGYPTATITLIGRPVPQRELSPDAIRAQEIIWSLLERPQSYQEMRVTDHNGDTAAVYYSPESGAERARALGDEARRAGLNTEAAMDQMRRMQEEIVRSVGVPEQIADPDYRPYANARAGEPWPDQPAEDPPAEPAKREKPKLPKFGQMPVRAIAR